MSTERDSLERAIQKADTAVRELRNRDNPERYYLERLVEAARKHLETLPKTVTKWRVSHKPDDFTIRRTGRMADSENEALAIARTALQCGKRSVSIDKTEEPA